MGWYSKGSRNPKDYWQDPYGTNTNRERLFDYKFFSIRRATNGHAVRLRHAEKAPGITVSHEDAPNNSKFLVSSVQ